MEELKKFHPPIDLKRLGQRLLYLLLPKRSAKQLVLH